MFSMHQNAAGEHIEHIIAGCHIIHKQIDVITLIAARFLICYSQMNKHASCAIICQIFHPYTGKYSLNNTQNN